MPAAGEKVIADDLDAVEDYTIRGPIVRLIQQAAQSFTDSTEAAVTFGVGSEDIDTHGFHDTASNTSRITPTVAGYYSLSGVYITVARTDYNTIGAGIGKNGTVAGPRARIGPNAVSASRTATVNTILSANGTTDYFELFGVQDNVANAAVLTAVGGSFASAIECVFLRPL